MQSIFLDINIKKSNSKKSQAKPNLLGPHPHPQSLEVSSKVISGWFQLGFKSFKPQQLIFRKKKKLESMAAMPMSHLLFSLKMKREREGWATSTSTIT